MLPQNPAESSLNRTGLFCPGFTEASRKINKNRQKNDSEESGIMLDQKPFEPPDSAEMDFLTWKSGHLV